MKRLLLLLCVLVMAFAGCTTMKVNPHTTETLAKTAGMVTAMSLKQDKAKTILSSACAVFYSLNDHSNPGVAQSFLKDDLAKIWDEAYSQGIYSVCTVINGLVSYMELQTSDPTQENIELWKQCMSDFCSGVDQVWQAEAKKEAAVYRFLPGYASQDIHANTKICALIATGQPKQALD